MARNRDAHGPLTDRFTKYERIGQTCFSFPVWHSVAYLKLPSSTCCGGYSTLIIVQCITGFFTSRGGSLSVGNISYFIPTAFARGRLAINTVESYGTASVDVQIARMAMPSCIPFILYTSILLEQFALPCPFSLRGLQLLSSYLRNCEGSA